MLRLLLFILLASSANLAAQLNATLRGNLDYEDTVNDVWGYVAPDGTEYAIVGLNNGVSFVSLADPNNPREVALVAGDFSNWRDMKTFGEFAYSVADQRTSDEGITAFDLRNLPNSVTITRNTYNIPGAVNVFSRAHNIYVDTLRGVLLTAGGSTSIRDGGILMFDITEDPTTPRLIGMGPEIYAHDVFVLGNVMYASEINTGDLSLYDVTDYANVSLISRVETPFNFTHNAWSTSDGRYVFTTDERGNASVGSYDVSRRGEIELLDEYRPASSLNSNTIPHNVHVINNYLSISYYTDGLRVVDAEDPASLIEVANYDTWPGANGGFDGAWGAYPFLPSGLTLVSDRSTGLYVVEVDYKRAARLKGTLTDEFSGNPINNASVIISSEQVNMANSNPQGEYATGLGTAGTYSVTISARNYADLTVEVDLENGATLTLDTFLTPLVRSFDVNYQVEAAEGSSPLDGATIFMQGINGNNFTLVTDENGRANLNDIFVDERFTVYITKWGFLTEVLEKVNSEELQQTRITLRPGVMDDFVTDQGWMTAGENPAAGQWDRGVPLGTFSNGTPIAPDTDALDDLGNQAYVTGNRGGSIGTDDVDGGTATLVSPVFGPGLLKNNSLMVNYQYWFVNVSGNSAPDDVLRVSITNGTDTVLVRSYTESVSAWIKDSFRVEDFITTTDNLQFIISTSDLGSSPHVVEAGLDNFFVTNSSGATSTDRFFVENARVDVFPNPAAGPFTLAYDLPAAAVTTLRITDATGRLVSERDLGGNAGSVSIGAELASGFYLLEILQDANRVWTGKAVRE